MVCIKPMGFRNSGSHTGRRNYHLEFRSPRIRADGFYGFHNVHAIDYLAKHHVSAIEPFSDLRRDEELPPPPQ